MIHYLQSNILSVTSHRDLYLVRCYFCYTSMIWPMHQMHLFCRYMHQSNGLALVLVWPMFGAKPLREQCLLTANWPHGNKLQCNLNRNTNMFINEIAFQNVIREMEAILLPQTSFGLRVLSFPVFVCLCVHVSVRQPRACPCRNSSPARARITKFGSEVQNTWLRSLLFWKAIDLDHQGQN